MRAGTLESNVPLQFAQARLEGLIEKQESSSPMPKGVLQMASLQAKALTGKPQAPMPRGATNEQLTRAQGCSADGRPGDEGRACNG
eukprot:1358234-Alexandrium_andersonii.AAC.1